ncbi:hypothetical protein RIF29_12854 [Crotalaria pallida]|uniref:Uncharacterized protein n=1 Tax=Crotalaria pallida TaxID=3830 RepID=A0AAN9P1G8_CROPI
MGKGKGRRRTTALGQEAESSPSPSPSATPRILSLGLSPEHCKLLTEFSVKYTDGFMLQGGNLGVMYIMHAYETFGEFLVRLKETPAINWVSTEKQVMDGFLKSLHSFGFQDKYWKPALLNALAWVESMHSKMNDLVKMKESELKKYERAAKKRKCDFLESVDDEIYACNLRLKAPLGVL